MPGTNSVRKADLLAFLCSFQRLLPHSAPDPNLNITGAASDHFIVFEFIAAYFCDKLVAATLWALELYGNVCRFVHKHPCVGPSS
jgi:hypothetical protein